jgi:hypothetical protein
MFLPSFVCPSHFSKNMSTAQLPQFQATASLSLNLLSQRFLAPQSNVQLTTASPKSRMMAASVSSLSDGAKRLISLSVTDGLGCETLVKPVKWGVVLCWLRLACSFLFLRKKHQYTNYHIDNPSFTFSDCCRRHQQLLRK